MSIPENACTLWICENCLMHLANGECGGCHNDDGHESEPLSLIVDDKYLTLGMFPEQHSCEDPYNSLCDCENYGFSTNSCPACGTELYGNRFAATCWWPKDYLD